MMIPPKILAIREQIKQYQDLEDQLQRLEMEKDVLRTNIQAAMEEEQSSEMECPGVGAFKILTKRIWSGYGPEVQAAKKALDEAQLLDEQKGIATPTASNYLRYYPEKK